MAEAKSKGKNIHTRSAFLQGLFFLSLQSEKKIVAELRNELEYIHRLSEKYEMPVQKIALNYCLQQRNINNVLIGVDSEEQLLQNITYAGCHLTDELMHAINNIAVKDVDLLNPSLWKQ